MTLVAIDVGNTSTAAALWTDGAVSDAVHCDGGFAKAEAALDRLAAGRRIDAIAYASVVPRADAEWRAFAAGKKLRFITIDAGLADAAGIYSIDYPEPESIGADRLADAAGAVERYGAPVLVMDFGTALTGAVVTSDRVWRGGAIAPGLPLMRDYLHERTAKLPLVDLFSGGTPRTGRSTEEAMRFGAIYGCLGMAKEIAARLAQEHGEDFKRVATGGYAERTLSADPERAGFTIDGDLTLYGAGLLAAKGGFK